MIRKLLIVFASGLVLSIVALSAAWVVGGQDLMTRIGKHRSLAASDGERGEARTTRTLAFDGKDVLTIDVPVELEFVRGDKAEMTLSGPSSAIDALRLVNGTLSISDSKLHLSGIRVTITAPQLAGLVLKAPGDVELRDLDQPTLRLDVHGPADVEASGRVTTLAVDTRGVGSLDLTDLHAQDAKASISGVGSVDLYASGKVEADISGAGSVVLHHKPAVLATRTTGIGSIDHDY